MTREEYAKRPGRSGHWISAINRLAIYLRDGFTCGYCGTDLHGAAPKEIHLDHLRPRVTGGENLHAPRNLTTACRRCNCARKDTPWTEYATAGARARIERNRRRTPNRALAQAIIRGTVPRPTSSREG